MSITSNSQEHAARKMVARNGNEFATGAWELRSADRQTEFWEYNTANGAFTARVVKSKRDGKWREEDDLYFQE